MIKQLKLNCVHMCILNIRRHFVQQSIQLIQIVFICHSNWYYPSSNKFQIIKLAIQYEVIIENAMGDLHRTCDSGNLMAIDAQCKFVQGR